MEILNSYITEIDGDKHLISFVHITDRAYIVNHIMSVCGEWRANLVEEDCRNFHSYDKAEIYYNKLYESIK